MHSVIDNPAELAYFLQADIRSCGLDRVTWKEWCLNPILRFQRYLRLTEFSRNTCRSVDTRIMFYYRWSRLNRLRLKLGFTIPLNVFGPGLSISHYGTIVINKKAVIGANCRIHPGVCIGGLRNKAPVIGNNVYIGPGAKIFGDINIGDNVAIGANSVVNKDVPRAVTVTGNPAEIVSDKGSSDMIIPGTELVGQKNPDWWKYRNSEVLAGRFTDSDDYGEPCSEKPVYLDESLRSEHIHHTRVE